MRIIFLFILFLFSCNRLSNSNAINEKLITLPKNQIVPVTQQDENGWLYFLQHLPIINGPVLDYMGNPVPYQQKHVAIINYDVGTKDLQQCADALMRLRAEYLFQQQRYHEIKFHFVSGRLYSWDEYCSGVKPVSTGNNVKFIKASPSPYSHESLRSYLDVVYNYASTISLSKELKSASGFAPGIVVIHPGSPGHCFIIIDEATDREGKKLFKLVEGYSPAQSIYVLSNLIEPEISPWYHLQGGPITTSSCRFLNYELKSFE